MKHEKAKRLLADYAVGRLRGRTKAKIEQHISECPICERELKALRQMEKLLTQVGLLRPSNPQHLLNRIREATQQAYKPSQQTWSWQLSRQWFLKPAIGFATLFLLAVSAFMFWHQTHEQPNLTVSYEQYHRLVSWSNPLGNWIETGISEMGATQ